MNDQLKQALKKGMEQVAIVADAPITGGLMAETQAKVRAPLSPIAERVAKRPVR